MVAEYLDLLSSEKTLETCVEITVKEVFLHCAKALMLSELWSLTSKINRSSFIT